MKRLIGLIFVMFMMSCQHTAPPAPFETETTQKSDPVAVSGGELKLSMKKPSTLHPLWNMDYGIDQMLKLIYEPLLIVSNDWDIQSNLIESFEMSDDARFVVCNLVDHTWHDGRPITSDDFLYSYQQIEKAKTSLYKQSLTYISSVEKINEKSFRVFFKNPGYINLYALLFPIVPAHVYEQDPNNLQFIGSGPFRMESYEDMKQMRLVKTKGFKKEPYISSIQIHMTSGDDAMLYAFGEGFSDVMFGNLQTLSVYYHTREYDMLNYLNFQMDGLALNANHYLFQDINIKKAISLAVERKEMQNGLYLSFAEEAQSVFPEKSFFLEKEQYAEIEKNNALQALEYLSNSGYIHHEGLVVKDVSMLPLRIRLLVNEDNSLHKKAAQKIQEDFNRIGIELYLDAVKANIYAEKFKTGDYELAFFSYQFPLMPRFDQLLGPHNPFQYRNEQMQQLLDQYNLAAERESFKRAANALHHYFQEELPFVPVVFCHDSLIYAKNMKDVEDVGYDCLFRKINHFYLQP